MKALLLIDFQHDFSSFGALAHAGAHSALQQAKHYLQQDFQLRIASQNWIPATHTFFAANHYFRYPKQLVTIHGKEERLWPIYGVQESFGADWMMGLPVEQLDKTLQKGMDANLAPYSCFTPAASFDLHAYLSEHNISTLVLGGFLTEFAVYHTALDALQLGYQVVVVKRLCAAANLDSDQDDEAIFKALETTGVQLIP
ncbi:MAG: isochorismatase family protein [Aureispira sp.]